MTKKNDSINRLLGEIEKMKTGSTRTADERFWNISESTDKAGNGYAVIRFLPAPTVDGDDALPWVKRFRHSFKGPTGSWYIENSLTTLGQPDPVSDYNSRLWNSGIESDKDISRKQKRVLQYIFNIVILKDSKNPQNEGKEFLFRCGKKIFDKITEALNPPFEDKEPINPFDLKEGADFKLKVRKLDGYPNYDLSEFDNPSPLANADAHMAKAHSLKAFLDQKEFESYDKLLDRLNNVLGIDTKGPDLARPGIAERPSAPVSVKAPTTAEAVSVADESSDEDDEELARFQELAASS